MIRFFDILFSLLGLIIIFPFFLLIAIAIKVESKGPIFYLQERVGKDSKVFKLYKFRSMYVNSDRLGLITIGSNDNRITRTGRFIRKFKLDELPQLINVLIGSMSIVGPRPEVLNYVNLYTENQTKVLSIKPGITDFASIYFKNENDILSSQKNPEEYYIKKLIPQKIRLNMIYINNYNLKTYFHIIIKTIWSVFIR
jgi:lipopolysaccharide/colanic/teichoic acid biosynthesis glycosyltransferase